LKDFKRRFRYKECLLVECKSGDDMLEYRVR
jgi:hypothetical protein